MLPERASPPHVSSRARSAPATASLSRACETATVTGVIATSRQASPPSSRGHARRPGPRPRHRAGRPAARPPRRRTTRTARASPSPSRRPRGPAAPARRRGRRRGRGARAPRRRRSATAIGTSSATASSTMPTQPSSPRTSRYSECASMTCTGGAGRSRSHSRRYVPAPVPCSGSPRYESRATRHSAMRPLLPTWVSRVRRSGVPGRKVPRENASRWVSMRPGRSKATDGRRQRDAPRPRRSAA